MGLRDVDEPLKTVLLTKLLVFCVLLFRKFFGFAYFVVKRCNRLLPPARTTTSSLPSDEDINGRVKFTNDLQSARNFREYLKVAATLDRLDGLDKWKHDPGEWFCCIFIDSDSLTYNGPLLRSVSPLYNYAFIQQKIAHLRTLSKGNFRTDSIQISELCHAP
jgi:hypothetical protein